MRHTPAFHTHKKRQLHLNVAFSLIVDGTAEAVAVATAAAGVAAATVAKKKKEKIIFIWLWSRFVAHTQRITPYVTISSSGGLGIC